MLETHSHCGATSTRRYSGASECCCCVVVQSLPSLGRESQSMQCIKQESRQNLHRASGQHQHPYNVCVWTRRAQLARGVCSCMGTSPGHRRGVVQQGASACRALSSAEVSVPSKSRAAFECARPRKQI